MTSNKAVLVNGNIVFGYTGISRIDNVKTDDWLARVAATSGIPDMKKVALGIRDEATQAFKKMRFGGQYKRHAFQGAGWFSKDGDTLVPGILTIENALDFTRNEWLPYARADFRLSSAAYKLSRNEFIVTSVGKTISPAEKNAVYQLLRKCTHRKRNRHIAITDALVLSMRWLSCRYEPNSSIGRNLMAVSLPRVASEVLEKTGVFSAFSMPGNEISATFLDILETGRAGRYGPHYVTNGVIISGFNCTPL